MQECQETVMECGLLGYLGTRDATQYRTCNKIARAAVAKFAWADINTRICRLREWRAAFPNATKANLSHNAGVPHHEFKYLEGVTALNMSYCESYSFINESFRHLTELRYLDLSHSWQDPTTWAFFREAFNDDLFKHLCKLETLVMDGYFVNQFSGAFSAHLPRLRELRLRNWRQGPRNCRAFFASIQKVELYVSNDCDWVFNNWDVIPREWVHIAGPI